jgi:hypothetical protein
MAVFTVEHTARKPHTCSRCLCPIRPGQRYERARITPRHDDYDNPRWLRYDSHLTYKDCENASE